MAYESASEQANHIIHFKLAQININGCNTNNNILRKNILRYGDAGFISVNGTHKKNEHEIHIHVPDYSWIGYNRKYHHVRLVRAFDVRAFSGVQLFV